MRAPWVGRWFGVACGVAGCAPMLAGLIGGVAGAVGAQGMGSAMAMSPMAGPAMGAAGMAGQVPGWVVWLGRFSWPLLGVSVVLLVASFWRTRPLPRTVAYAGVALLIANQFHMTPWLFLPALALVLLAFLLATSAAGARQAFGPGPSALPGRLSHPPR